LGGIDDFKSVYPARGSGMIFRRTREDMMQIGSYRSTPSDDLLDCRMAMLGLDLSAVEGYDGTMFEAIRQRCASCHFRVACELDLKRDPNDPVWETYCPSTAVLLALPEACWLGAR
jgi:hypothetical protein